MVKWNQLENIIVSNHTKLRSGVDVKVLAITGVYMCNTKRESIELILNQRHPDIWISSIGISIAVGASVSYVNKIKHNILLSELY
jgi:hypothetical protein